MSLNRRQQLDYNQKYQVQSARVNFAHYVQVKQEIDEGNKVGLNIFPPDNNVSIVSYIKEGEVNTTPEELNRYLGIDTIISPTIPPYPATVPGAPTSLGVIPGNQQITVSFDPPSDDGGTPITNYEYSVDNGTTWVNAFVDPSSNIFTITTTDGVTNLSNLVSYEVILRAQNSAGIGDSSSSVSVILISNSFTPSLISGLNTWLNAQDTSKITITSGKVSSWNDSSSAVNNFTASVTGTILYSMSSTINNRPALNFTTSAPTISTYLSKDNYNIAPTNELSLFMVLVQTGRGVPGNSELFYTRNDYRYFDLFTNTNLGSDGPLSINVGSATQISSGVDIITTPPSIVIISVIITSSGNMYVNGSQTNNNFSKGGLSLNDGTLDWTLSGGAFLGNIGEVITYPSGLSNSNRQQIEGYLSWKWGLQTQLPSSHPFRYAPPVAIDAPVITSITARNQSLIVNFTQTNPGFTITNYNYSTDGGTTFRTLSPSNNTTPITITTLSSDGVTILTNGISYNIIIQAITTEGSSPVSNTISGTPVATVVSFTSVGSTTWTVPSETTSISYLIVAGGGGGGGGYDTGGGGGGGGGMVLTGTQSVTSSNTYTITVGSGGAASTNTYPITTNETDGGVGGNSSFESIIALGGDGGKRSRFQTGGSGLGGAAQNSNVTSARGGNGGGSNGGGGGGGGATASGNNKSGTTPGNGGAGLASSISGVSVTYGAGGLGATGNFFATGASGTANTGNGGNGGGAASGGARNGGAGGSGIVIITY
jgi:hypothetical protein